MKPNPEIVDRLVHPGVIAVIRAERADQVPPLAQALVAGGVLAIEVTLTTPNAEEAIRSTRNCLGAQAIVGVGSVIHPDQARAAIDAGAQFVVSPIGRADLVSVAHGAACPVMLGACTPTEAQLVHESGADFVKLFPADVLGPPFVKAIRAPLPHLRIVPTGGVELHNAAEFIRAGCVALGVGSALVPREWVREAKWDALTQRAREFVSRVEEGRGCTKS